MKSTTTEIAVAEDSMEVTTTTSSSTTSTEPSQGLSLKALIKKTGKAPKWLHPRRLKKSKIVKKKSAKAGKQKLKFQG